jgi:exosome complex component RRP4
MSKLLFEKKQVVVPGDIIAEGMDYLPGKGAFREGDKVISSRLGLMGVKGSIINIIPLSGKYQPNRGDTVIGYVRDMSYSSWFVNVGCAYDASLSMRDATSDFIERGASLSNYFAVGDIIMTSITNVTNEGNMDLTMKGPGLRKMIGGKVVEITPAKVPRAIGKQGSMISMIKEKTGCTLFAGQNGRVWIKGPTPEAERLATDAIMLIEEKSHVQGLTEKVKLFLEARSKEIKK